MRRWIHRRVLRVSTVLFSVRDGERPGRLLSSRSWMAHHVERLRTQDEFSRRRLRNRRNLAEAERLALAEIVGRETVVERDERLSLRFPVCPKIERETANDRWRARGIRR